MISKPKSRLSFIVILILPSVLTFSAKSVNSQTSLSPAEQYVLSQVAQGKPAKLSEAFAENERVIDASFLEDLIINANHVFQIHRNGIHIEDAVILDKIDLSNAEVSSFVYLSKCHLNAVEFFQTTFKKGLVIDHSIFDGDAYFGYADVAGPFSVNETRFKAGADFNMMKVNGPAFLRGARFECPVTFLYAVIKGNFEISNASVENTSEASFNSMTVERGFFAIDASFDGSVDLINLHVADNFQGEGARFNSTHGKVNFDSVNLGLNCLLMRAESKCPVIFNGANVHGRIDLDKAHFSGNQSAQFEDVKVSALSIKDTKFDSPPDFYNLTCEEISPWDRFFGLLKDFDSKWDGANSSGYSQLESYLQKNGYPSEADEVFITKKRYERNGLRWNSPSIAWSHLASYLSDWIQGFGRKPQKVVWLDVFIVWIGAMVFRRRKMVRKKKLDETETASAVDGLRPYNSFFYSATLFAPSLDSQYTTNWEPDSKRRLTRLYVPVQKALGWALVPLTIAIWTGIFK